MQCRRMEEDDFGFTRRKESVLRKVSSNRESGYVVEGTVDEEDENSSKEVNCSAGAEGTGYGGSVIPEESEGVSRHDGGGNTRSGGTSPETGSEEASKRSGEGSVGPQTPNIPNVVEYHLKVKPALGGNTRRVEDKPFETKDDVSNVPSA